MAKGYLIHSFGQGGGTLRNESNGAVIFSYRVCYREGNIIHKDNMFKSLLKLSALEQLNVDGVLL